MWSAAALRLARFNIQTGSTDKNRFTGLPVPGAALMIASLVLAYSYFELDSPRTLEAVAAPLTVALSAAMISRVPYPSFKSVNLRRRAPLEILIGVLVAAAFFLALPQLTMFALATAYVLSGPILMLSGEKMTKKVPVLRPVPADRGAPTIAARPALCRIASTRPRAASSPIASGTALGQYRLDWTYGASLTSVSPCCFQRCCLRCYSDWPLEGPTPGASRGGPERLIDFATNASGEPSEPPEAFSFARGSLAYRRGKAEDKGR